MTREDAIREIDEHIQHALREIESANWKMEDIGYPLPLQHKVETVMKKLIGLTYDMNIPLD